MFLGKIVWSIVYIVAYTYSPDGGLIEGYKSGTSLTYYSSKERCEAAASRDARAMEESWWTRERKTDPLHLMHLAKYQYACVPHLEAYAVGLDRVPENETWQVPESPPLPERKPVR